MISAVWVSGIVVAQSNADGRRCGRGALHAAHKTALSHLFCAVDHEHQPGQRCPHERARQDAVRVDRALSAA